MKKQFKNPTLTNIRNSATMKQFLLSLLATTISIVLTFGTSAIIEKRHKEAAKREMVMMIIYDVDKTIEQVQNADSAFREASLLQQEVALHPENYDRLRFRFMPAVMCAYTEFAETTEKIFSSNIETFNTLGNVNFVQEVSSFYNARRAYQETVLVPLKEMVSNSPVSRSIEDLFNFDFPECSFSNSNFLETMRKTRNRCMQMMKVKEDELEKFSRQRSVTEDNSEEDNTHQQQMLEELIRANEIIKQAKEKLGEDK